MEGPGAPSDGARVCVEHGTARLQQRVAGASAEQVWAALTTAAGLERWLGRLDGGAPREGSSFALWHDAATRSEHEVVRWEPGRALGLTWLFPDEPPSEVVLLLQPDASGCLVEVRHRGLVDPVEYAAGWHRHLELLAAALRDDAPPTAFWDGHDERVAAYAALAASGPACAPGRACAG